MEHTISRLLKAYENGKLHRRDLVKGLTLLAAGSGSASAAGFQSNGINHVSLQVSDLQRSSEFYQRVLVVPAENRPAGTRDHAGHEFGGKRQVVHRGLPDGDGGLWPRVAPPRKRGAQGDSSCDGRHGISILNGI